MTLDAVTAAAQAFHDAGVADGEATQAATDRAALEAAQSQYTTLLADYDAYVAAHSTQMLFGDSYASSAATYAKETAAFGYQMSFRYKTPDLMTVPADQDAILSVAVGTTASSLEAICVQWETTHTGLLYLTPLQEPENEIASGAFTPAQYLATSGDIVATVASHPRVISAWHWQAISVPDDGSAGPLEQMWQQANPAQRPAHLSFSCYALVKNNKPTADPVKQPTKVATYAQSKGCSWGVGATGYPLAAADIANPTLQARRQTYATTHKQTSEAQGSRHWLWFNTGDYQLGNDPALAQALTG